MTSLSVNHLLKEVLEQLYHTHMQLYGEIRKDCLIILDVAQVDEQAVLSEKIHLAINTDDGHAGMLLRQFTDLPVFGIELWNELRGLEGVMFEDLHIGLEGSIGFLSAEQQSLSLDSAVATTQAERLRAFSRFIRNTDHFHPKINDSDAHPTLLLPRVFFAQGTSNCVVLNIEDLVQEAVALGVSSDVGDLSTVSFQDQLQLFHHIDVLVAVAGTALHNVLFMRPGSAVVLFMQPQWCEWAWMYATQAVLLGIRPFVYCATEHDGSAAASSPRAVAELSRGSVLVSDEDGTEEVKTFQWSRQFWKQGPRHHKFDNITVDPVVFAELLENALAYVDSPSTGVDVDESRTKDLVLPQSGLVSSSTQRHPLSSLSRPSSEVTSSQDTELRRRLELYVSSVRVVFLGPNDGWRVAITGEIGTTESQIEPLMRSMPHLAFCLTIAGQAPFCHPISAFTYDTDLLLDMDRPLQSLHLWAQVSTTGGKIRHSDVFLELDCRLPNAGFNLHQLVIGHEVYFEVDIQENCVNSATGARRHQRLRYPTRKFGVSNATCAGTTRVAFAHQMTSRLSLQRFSADFCAEHALNMQNCADFLYELQQYLWRILKGSQLQLPMVQIMPTQANPFLFVHIEKTAGSTLRSYILESTVDNSTALIPCLTIHCAIFAVPRHLPPNETITSDPHVLLSELSDLRLVQPPARDISNLTVIAGHFDFYAAYDSLPQCRSPGDAYEPIDSAWSPFSDDLDAVTARLPPVPTPECRVSCFTMGRHPVDRAISYYYQRFYRPSEPLSDSAEAAPFGGRTLEQRMVNELTVEQLRKIARLGRDHTESEYFPGVKVLIDEGLSDSACKMLLGLRHTTGKPVNSASFPPPIPAELYSLARQNLQQCVVGIQERWSDTLRVLDHWLPWIDFSVEPARRENHKYNGTETRATLRPELVRVLEEANPCDMMLYEEMLRIFQVQLQTLDSPTTIPTI